MFAVAVVAGHEQAEAAVGGDARVALGQVVAHVAGDVGQDVGPPHLAGVVQERLVVEREVAGPHHAATAGHAHGADVRPVERPAGPRA